MAQEIADSKLLDTWGSGGTKIEPDISKVIEGWQLGEQPPHEYMNWLQNTFGSKLNHILKNGIAEWNNETEYLSGSSVKHSGNVWLCETTNTNSEPTDLNANWEKVAINKDLTLTVDTVDDLRSISYPANTVWASGYHAKNDGAFGSHIFRLKGVKTTETDNGGTIIIATIGGTDYVYELQYDGAVNVKWFGAKGDGITDDSLALDLAIAAAGTTSLHLSAGEYLISNKQLIFAYDVVFDNGAEITVNGNGSVTFYSITAGNYKIFNSDNDFITTYEEDTKIKILRSVVKVDWFASSSYSADLVQHYTDQSNNIMKAIRAGMGNFVGTSPKFTSEIASGKIQLGSGWYKVDNTIHFGKLVNGNYYRVSGCHFTGSGAGASFLMRTDLNSTSAVFSSMYTGQLTQIDNFKITAFDINSGTPYASQASCGMYLQGDSLQLENIWSSGFQVGINDTNGVKRNGVGIQFGSCVDTYLTNVFVENCITGIAFASSIISGVNVEVYRTTYNAFGIGNFIAGYPDEQTTSSRINLINVQAPAVEKYCFTILERGEDAKSCLNISNSMFDGYNYEFSSQRGTHFIYMVAGTTIKPVIASSSILNFSYRTVEINSGCSFGSVSKPAVISSSIIHGQTSSPTTGVIYNVASGAACINVYVKNTGFSSIAGVLYYGGMINNNSQVTLENIQLSKFYGISDNSSSRQLVVGDGNIKLSNFTRDISDTVALTRLAYWGSGVIDVDISPLFWNATRTIVGAATKIMTSKTTFV